MPRHKDSNAWFQKATKVSEDPAASDWLKTALAGAVNRDPVNAAGDAEVLHKILELRAEAALEGRAPAGANGKAAKLVV